MCANCGLHITTKAFSARSCLRTGRAAQVSMERSFTTINVIPSDSASTRDFRGANKNDPTDALIIRSAAVSLTVSLQRRSKLKTRRSIRPSHDRRPDLKRSSTHHAFNMYSYLILHRLLLLLLAETFIRHTLALGISFRDDNPLGINCRGSIICTTMGHRGYVYHLEDIMRVGFDTSCVYPNGQHIACVSTGHRSKGVCAFLQGTAAGFKGDDVLYLIAYLAAHNCDNCGSIPIGYPKSNDPGAGILTVNYVDSTANPCPDGICFSCNSQKNVIMA